MPSPSHPSSARASRLIARREALEVDAAVDDLGLSGGLRDGLLELSAQPLGHRDDRGGAPDDVPRRGADPAELAPMFATSWPWAVTTSGAREASAADEPGRDEEVRVDDVRPDSPGAAAPHRGSRRACRPLLRRGDRPRRARSRDRATGARARGRRRTPRDPGPPGPGTSARRGGSAGCATRA